MAGFAFYVYTYLRRRLGEKVKSIDKIRQYALELQLKYGSSPSTAPSDAELQVTAREIYDKLSKALSLANRYMEIGVYNDSKEFARVVDQFARTRSPERNIIFDKATNLQNKVAASEKEFTILKFYLRRNLRRLRAKVAS